ncbi:N-acetyltransferase [Streptomyces yangpuensis]|uniref:N-acetyltransferase n=1 Tax=Streptomyces yangpuensis TaxID=1648182 RepID=UPI0034191298
MVHVRKIVGQVHYRICTDCGQGLITGIDIDGNLVSSGLGNRALSHLRARHPGMSWRSTLSLRTTRNLLRRMRIPAASADVPCVHGLTAAGPAATAGSHGRRP